MTKKGIRNPFRNAEMRRVFDDYVALFYDGKLRNPNGTQSRGGSNRAMFWRGYDGEPNLLAPKGSTNYACYRAGQAVKKKET